MAVLKDSLVTGDLRVTGTIYGKATNAVLADEATAVRDKGNGTLTYLNYGAAGMSTTSWIGSWDGYTLKAISPANLKTTMALNNVENTKLSTWAGSGNITTIGTLTSGTVPWARLSGVPSTMTPSSHTHGNITNDGKIGTTANQAAYTTTNGVVTAGTLPAAAGGTGKTTLKDAANALINALDTGSSNLTANDYVITQYVGGGSTTTTYHRRPASALRVGGLLTARTFTIGSTGKTFDGTGNVSWTLAEIGAAASNHNHDSTYVNVSGDTMTGALILSGDPTSAKHAATKQYVDQSFAANDAMIFKGTIGSSGATVTELPATHSIGWTYRVLTAGTYAGVKCEIGDLIICITDGTSANNAHWTVAQTNLDGAVIGPASATSGNFALFDGTSGKLIKNSSYSPSSFAAASHGTHVTYGTSAAAVGTTASAGSASTVSRSDHVHSIALATGDNNGQVKIAGTNVSVKGLGSAAYTNSSAYAAASHTHNSIVTVGDQRGVATTPDSYSNKIIFQGLKTNSSFGSPSSDRYSYVIGLRGWSDSSGGNSHELAFNDTGIFWRSGATTSWGNWYRIYTTANKPTATDVGLGNVLNKAITVTSSSVSDGTNTFNKYTHPAYTAHNAAAVKIGNDATGHVVIGSAITASDVGAAAANHTHSYLPLSGGTMTGQLKTSFKSSVAMGTYQATATTIGDLCEELRYSSGVAGSANITTAYTKDGVTIGTKWYNFIWVPHRSGGINGTANGDNSDYGSLYLSGMTGSGLYMIRYANEAIAEVKDLYKDTTYGAEKGISLSSGKFGHSNTAITAQNTQALYPIKIDAYGHITGYGTAVTSLPASDVYSWAKASTKPTYTYSEVGAAAAGHTHPTTLATDTGTSSITLASAGKYKLTAGGNSVIFTMPTSNNYTHPTSAGNKHIPSGGEDYQILVYGGSSGTAKWESLHRDSFTCVRTTDSEWYNSLTQITSWTTNTPTQVTKKTVVTNATVSNEVLTFTTGDSVTVTAGTAASLNYNNYEAYPDYFEFYDSIGEPIPN